MKPEVITAAIKQHELVIKRLRLERKIAVLEEQERRRWECEQEQVTERKAEEVEEHSEP